VKDTFFFPSLNKSNSEKIKDPKILIRNTKDLSSQ
jgi:hypothetical protein